MLITPLIPYLSSIISYLSSIISKSIIYNLSSIIYHLQIYCFRKFTVLEISCQLSFNWASASSPSGVSL